jgi:hypothetical protein
MAKYSVATFTFTSDFNGPFAKALAGLWFGAWGAVLVLMLPFDFWSLKIENVVCQNRLDSPHSLGVI